jgi:hypothetical protein
VLNTVVQTKASITSVCQSCDGSVMARVKVFARESESARCRQERKAKRGASRIRFNVTSCGWSCLLSFT